MKENCVLPYDYASGKGLVKSVIIRQSSLNGGIHVCVVAASSKLPAKERLIRKISDSVKCMPLGNNTCVIKGITLNVSKSREVLSSAFVNLFGDNYITDRACGLNLNISPDSFFQVNTNMAERLYEKVFEFVELTENDLVIDAYCGIGAMALSAGKKAKDVIGVELVSSAVNDAIKNAEHNGIKNVRFVQGDAGLVFRQLFDDGIHPNVLILDPPRSGCGKQVLEGARKLAPEKIVYVSCDAATLARDLKIMSGLGYNASVGACFDMFGRCAHVESVVLLTRKDG